MAKNLQTKGIRFKCKLCNALLTSKAPSANAESTRFLIRDPSGFCLSLWEVGAADHFKKVHPREVQTFKSLGPW